MFGDLSRDASYDGDNDGVIPGRVRDSSDYGQPPLPTTSWRAVPVFAAPVRCLPTLVEPGGLMVGSDPPGLLDFLQKLFLRPPPPFTGPNKNGLSNGYYYFSHWEINGVRQADNQGLGLSEPDLIEHERVTKTVIAKYFPGK